MWSRAAPAWTRTVWARTASWGDAFQVEMDADYVDIDAFSELRPVKVPARTLLSQLV